MRTVLDRVRGAVSEGDLVCVGADHRGVTRAQRRVDGAQVPCIDIARTALLEHDRDPLRGAFERPARNGPSLPAFR